MESTSTISRTVMRRVRTVHAVRPLLSGASLASLVFIIALWGIGREVWVAHVLQNLEITARTGGLGTFLVAAFMNTRFIVQVLVILAAGAFIYTLRELARTFTLAHRYV